MSDSIKEFAEKVSEGQANVIKIAQEVLGDDGKAVTFRLENQRVMPDRMESPARSHVFHDAAGFVRYLEDNKKPNTLVLADVDDVTIHAVLDDRADKGFEVITLCPPYHPVFQLLNETLLNQTLPIDVFARNVMRNRSIIVDSAEVKGQDLALAMQQITISDAVTTEVGVGTSSLNGLMCKTEITAGKASERLELPKSFRVKVPIYLNTAEKEFEIDMTVTKTRDGVVAIVDCPEVAIKKQEVFEDILTEVKTLKDINVTYGSPATTSWRYNK